MFKRFLRRGTHQAGTRFHLLGQLDVHRRACHWSGFLRCLSRRLRNRRLGLIAGEHTADRFKLIPLHGCQHVAMDAFDHFVEDQVACDLSRLGDEGLGLQSLRQARFERDQVQARLCTLRRLKARVCPGSGSGRLLRPIVGDLQGARGPANHISRVSLFIGRQLQVGGPCHRSGELHLEIELGTQRCVERHFVKRHARGRLGQGLLH